ncbi:MAG: NnrU family protein [Propylenella sp.]
MIVLILGLVLFLGIHSVMIGAAGWRAVMVARLGEGPWKGLYSLVAAVGLVLIVWGYGLARQDPVVFWVSPTWLKHVAVALNLVAFILFAAYRVPAGWIKARLGHPMVLSVKVWAFAHLLANGTLADVLLFGSFLVWAVADFRSSVARDRAAGTVRIAGPPRNDLIAVAVGVVLWAAFVWFLHEWLFGVSPIA